MLIFVHMIKIALVQERTTTIPRKNLNCRYRDATYDANTDKNVGLFYSKA